MFHLDRDRTVVNILVSIKTVPNKKCHQIHPTLHKNYSSAHIHSGKSYHSARTRHPVTSLNASSLSSPPVRHQKTQSLQTLRIIRSPIFSGVLSKQALKFTTPARRMVGAVRAKVQANEANRTRAKKEVPQKESKKQFPPAPFPK